MKHEVTKTGKVLHFADFIKYSDTIIETGTGRLGGVHLYLNSGFNVVKTVEACEAYYQENLADLLRLGFKEEVEVLKCNRLKKWDAQVDLFFGMSQDKIGEMIDGIDKPFVAFLDAHVSGPNSAGHEDYMEKGNDSQYAQDNVITAELKIILAHRKDHVILIDDQNGENDENQKYMDMIIEANPNYKFYFYDEKRGDVLYENKCLVCIPE